jgi:hypothetical protein
MARSRVVSFAAGLVLVVASARGVSEKFPVMHNEPITIRILGGKDGQPLGRMHLTLIAGYDRSDMRKQLFREDVLTDVHGQLRLSNQLANLPWLQVWVEKKKLCQENPRIASFSVELMRRDGLSTPNHCGMVAVEDKPGVFNVFVKGTGAVSVPVSSAAVQTQTSHAAVAPKSVDSPAVTGSPAVLCSCKKKTQRPRSVCGRRIPILPGVALYLR